MARNTPNSSPGFLQDILMHLRLVYRLMGDERVNPLVKLLPIGALLYLVMPLDLALGPLDDAAVIGLISYLFIGLCPDDVVQEHKRSLQRRAGTESRNGVDDGLIIDGKFVDSGEPTDPKT